MRFGQNVATKSVSPVLTRSQLGEVFRGLPVSTRTT